MKSGRAGGGLCVGFVRRGRDDDREGEGGREIELYDSYHLSLSLSLRTNLSLDSADPVRPSSSHCISLFHLLLPVLLGDQGRKPIVQQRRAVISSKQCIYFFLSDL